MVRREVVVRAGVSGGFGPFVCSWFGVGAPCRLRGMTLWCCEGLVGPEVVAGYIHLLRRRKFIITVPSLHFW